MQKTNSNPNTLPSSFTQVSITTKYTLLDYIRSRRFYILLSLTLLIGGLMTAVVGYFRPNALLGAPLSFYGTWWTQSIPFIIVLSGIFFGADAISSESQNKTGYFSIPNPIRRSTIYVGKWLAAFSAATVIFLLFSAVTIGNGLYYFGANIPTEFFASLLFSWLYLAAVVSFSFLFSAIFKNTAMSILVTAILFLFAFDLTQALIQSIIQIEPWFIITYGAGIITNIFTIPYPLHTLTFTEAGQTITLYTATVPEGIAILALYAIITTALGLLLFERKEFT